MPFDNTTNVSKNLNLFRGQFGGITIYTMCMERNKDNMHTFADRHNNTLLSAENKE